MKTQFIEVVQLAEDIFEFRFKKPESFVYIAGQFIELTLTHSPADARGEKRWFTLSSSPTESHLSITTKKTAKSSSFKSRLFSLKKNEMVFMSEPIGDFVLPRNKHKPLLFVAAGIGITPYRSICKWLIDTKQQRNITMLYAASLSTHFVYQDSIEKTGNVIYIESRPTTKNILEHAARLDNPQLYLSGPEELVEALFAELSGHFSQSQLICDYFHNYAGAL